MSLPLLYVLILLVLNGMIFFVGGFAFCLFLAGLFARLALKKTLG